MDSSQASSVNPLVNAALTSIINNAMRPDEYVKPSVFHTDPDEQVQISGIDTYARLSLLGSQPQVSPEQKKLQCSAQWSGSIYIKNMTGKTIQFQVLSSQTIQDLKQKIQIKEGIDSFRQKLIKGGKDLKNQETLAECGIQKEEVLHIIVNMRAQPPAYKLKPDLLHPQYDYDFTNLQDTKPYYRGGVQYYRPCGWRRFALRVNGRYQNDNWLLHTGKADNGEWMVSYHGSTKRSADTVLNQEEKEKFYDQYQQSVGIFSTPKVEIAEQYAKTFLCEGVQYKVVIQNRINPKRCLIINNGDYFMCPEIELRPYGVLIKKV